MTSIALNHAYAVPDWQGLWVARPVSRRPFPGLDVAKYCWMFPVDVEESVASGLWVLAEDGGALNGGPQSRSDLVRRGLTLIKGVLLPQT